MTKTKTPVPEAFFKQSEQMFCTNCNTPLTPDRVVLDCPLEDCRLCQICHRLTRRDPTLRDPLLRT